MLMSWDGGKGEGMLGEMDSGYGEQEGKVM